MSFILFFFMISSFYCGVWFCVILLQCFVFRRLITVFYLCLSYLNGLRDNKSDYGCQYITKLKLYVF